MSCRKMDPLSTEAMMNCSVGFARIMIPGAYVLDARDGEDSCPYPSNLRDGRDNSHLAHYHAPHGLLVIDTLT